MGQQVELPPHFFRRLSKDVTANTLVISAASLVPLMAMVGGGVDASRYYMAETRLQAACDAGALAARRSMADDNFSRDDRVNGENFFDENYPDGTFGLEELERNFTATESGQVNGAATGKLPTAIMGPFGFDDFSISVTCEADVNISNTDVLFVVDVTGSMNCAPDNPGGGNCGNSEDPGAKIQGLRSAVMTFYDTVETSTSPSAQVRYGMVPYASNVNVGASLMAANPAWMAQVHTYQSRQANFETTSEWGNERIEIVRYENYDYDDEEYLGVILEGEEYGLSSSQCAALQPADIEFDVRSDLGTHEGSSGESISGDERRTFYRDGNETLWRLQGGRGYRSSDGRCRYGWLVYESRGDVFFNVVEDRIGETETFQNWTYQPVTYNLASLYDDNSIALPIGTDGSNLNVRWDGCVEEANTVATDDFDPVPEDANDLKINLTPTNVNEFWKPVLRDAVWKRENDSGNVLGNLTQTEDENRPGYTCPDAAFRLTNISRADLQSYVDDLTPRSSTYHDIGMIWGARFISPNGIFAGSNASAPNGDAISRHIVFMTDGLLSPNNEIYNMYGVEWWDRRVTDNGSNGQASDRHATRFQVACRAARQENISVWVVAFGTTLTQNLIDCATPGRAFQANDTATLEARFEQIAQEIAALRLTQ
ncbi:hypothetical protein CD351_10285 [Erythrobacter sp. KY5]|uniref:Tad domain-containing protein n=1 Tax=Erythrobacter sp. KY5 TaxID=2011159 RepID=UPI000DBF1D1A|nr:Tad domain-containing protein [Erythrobacter sp. KY5]AWW74811.1 hypothetical protein CD351_10285 [Erythrobacter sp. KY5]